ncbi:hypothetical protein [Sphingomonas baiyangensis]|uniref:hypothetical protein n=1 Tax=Sphingomonas baiyangensis TaxID=2572576 RepID=UPI00146F4CDD|nr:hypothetical protein [Sphingomonas baiyangensis]
MRALTIGIIGAATMVAGCSQYGGGGLFGGAGIGGDPYYAEQYYRDGPNYAPRRLSRNDRIYAGRDGRYYCRRNDGTTGLIVGGIAGGALGSIISPGGSGLLGALLGGAAGAAAGEAIDRDNVTCR